MNWIVINMHIILPSLLALVVLFLGLAIYGEIKRSNKMTESNEKHYNPKGIEFIDKGTLREMKLITEGHSKGWICYKHPDGQWVTLREATEEDKRILGVPDSEIRDGAHGVKRCDGCDLNINLEEYGLELHKRQKIERLQADTCPECKGSGEAEEPGSLADPEGSFNSAHPYRGEVNE